jgi:cell shape-determining protein MreC
MKTQYFRRPKAFLTPLQSIALIGVVGVLLLLFLIRLFAPSFFVSLMNPVWQAGNSFTASASLPENAQTLQERVKTLEAENEILANENRALKARASDDMGSGIRAGVYVRPPVTPYDVLVIGKGTTEGIYEGMQMFSRSIPVGTVSSASDYSARVTLYSASGVQTEGWVGESRLPITLRGIGAGGFEADSAREAAVLAGDLVYLPGPGALPVGVVVSVESQPSSPRALLRIRPFANPFSMTEVEARAFPAL